MRLALALLTVVAVGCDKSEPHVDAAVVTIDAPPDAPPDANTMNIMTACTHVCDALGVCFGGADPGCVSQCTDDLLDCTPEQVQAVDMCSTQACGTQDDSPIINCIAMVACVMG
jgi:hypothetical protein